jgi:hypothetical protein
MNKIPIVIAVAALLSGVSAGWLLAQQQTKQTTDASAASAAIPHSGPIVGEVSGNTVPDSTAESPKELSDESSATKDRNAQAASGSEQSSDEQNVPPSSDKTTSPELAVNEASVGGTTASSASDRQIQLPEIAQSNGYLAALSEAEKELSPRMSLTAIIDDKAMFSFSTGVAKRNQLPDTLALRIGEEFKGIKLLQTDSNSVVLEEHGQRITKSLRSISAQRQQTALQDSTL